LVHMKLRLLSTFAAFFSVAAVAACATSTQTKIADQAPDGGTPGDTTPAEEESDDPALQPPHSLGTIILGEAHGSGTSKSTPIVSATFIPDAILSKTCKKKLTDACEIQEVPKCTKVTSSSTGCNSNELCSFDTSCKAVCKPIAVCETACEKDEVCKSTSTSGTSTTGECVKVTSFDAGPLAFSGTTTSITMFPPYSFESTGSGAPFLGGAELHVQASGATDAGFEKFDEKFTATTFLQTTPSLSKITRDKVFGTGALPIAWAPANDTILITVSGAGGSATCKVQDSLGKFDVPRSVVKAAQGDGTSTTTSSTSLSISVARQRKEVKKDKHAKGSLELLSVKPDGWLELVTLSTESASFQGCSSGQEMCGDTCTDTSYDRDNCGTCGNVCSSSQSCYNGTCSGGSSSGSTGTCTTCRSNAKVGSCSTYNSACQADVDCYDLSYCASNCTTASCISSCESQYPAGVTKWSPLKSCLSSYCSSSCGF
jgi:hypothetical protein